MVASIKVLYHQKSLTYFYKNILFIFMSDKNEEIKRLKIENIQLKREISKLKKKLYELIQKNKSLENSPKHAYFVSIVNYIFDNLRDQSKNKSVIGFYNFIESFLINIYIRFPIIIYTIGSLIFGCLFYVLYNMHTYVVIVLYIIQFVVLFYIWFEYLHGNRVLNRKIIYSSTLIVFWIAVIDILLEFELSSSAIDLFVSLFDTIPYVKKIIYIITLFPKFILELLNSTVDTVFILPRLLSIIIVTVLYNFSKLPLV